MIERFLFIKRNHLLVKLLLTQVTLLKILYALDRNFRFKRDKRLQTKSALVMLDKWLEVLRKNGGKLKKINKVAVRCSMASGGSILKPMARQQALGFVTGFLKLN